MQRSNDNARRHQVARSKISAVRLTIDLRCEACGRMLIDCGHFGLPVCVEMSGDPGSPSNTGCSDNLIVCTVFWPPLASAPTSTTQNLTLPCPPTEDSAVTCSSTSSLVSWNVNAGSFLAFVMLVLSSLRSP